MQSYFLVVYDWHSGQVLNFMDSQSEDMLMLYLQLTPCFYGGSVISSWARHVTPCPPALRCPRDQGSLRSWASSQVGYTLLDPHLRMRVSCCAWESPCPEAWPGRCFCGCQLL